MVYFLIKSPSRQAAGSKKGLRVAVKNENVRIIFEDGEIVCAVKPAGISSESDGGGGMPEILRNLTGKEIFPVHRLDRAVGGIMVYAIGKKSAAYLSALVADRLFEKEYLACVHGECPDCGEMVDLLFKDSRANKSYVVKRMRRGVKEARLSFEKLAEKDGATLVKIKLDTGRSHQIRVQFSSRKMPLYGDGKYGASDGCPIALWSHKVGFCRPCGEKLSFSAVPPDIFPWNLFGEYFENRR